jgi:hypothetical protein
MNAYLGVGLMIVEKILEVIAVALPTIVYVVVVMFALVFLIKGIYLINKWL